ncbi:MAG: ABC transporter permease [Coriobacteriia bacterium]|nr:ABC transporter permease [Coriobacteriia bacterium]
MAEQKQGSHISSMRQFKAILKKDIVMELRTKEMLTSMGLYALLVLLIYYIALSQAGSEFDVTNIAGGLLWLAIVFTSLLGLNRSLVHEKDQGCLDALLLAPVDRPVIFFGKAIGNLLFLLIVEVFVTPLFMLIFNAGKYSSGIATWGYLSLILIVGSIGIAGVGTLLATMSVNTTGKDFVLAVLFIPVMFPLLLAVVAATWAILNASPDMAVYWKMLGIAGGYDAIMLLAAYALYEFVLGA